MTQFAVLYLHGFLSSEQSQKGQWFRTRASQDTTSFITFNTLTYPLKTPTESVQVINLALQKMLGDKPVVIMGSSLGGFYARYFAHRYGLPSVLINPALNPQNLFPQYFGEHLNPHTGEKVCLNNDYLSQLQSYFITGTDQALPALLLIDKDDEVIDVPFALSLYSTTQTRVFAGGDHRFIHLDKAWQQIIQFTKALSA